MIKRNRTQINKLNILTDGVVVLLSFLLSSWLWLDVVKDNPGNMASIHNPDSLRILCTLAYSGWTVGILALFGVYRTDRIRSHRYRTIFYGNTAAFASLTTLLFFFRLQDFSRGVLELYYLFSTCGLVGKRAALYCLLRTARAKGYNQKHVLLVGSGTLAQAFIRSAARQPQLGIRIEEILDPDDRLPERLASRIQGDDIDEVVLALELHSLERTEQILRICEQNGVVTSVIPFYNAVIPASAAIHTVGSVKLIRLRTIPLEEPANAFAKRFFDICASAVLLVLLSPLFFFLALGVKLSGPGPVFFRQERVGRNRKPFRMWKFRSMRMNADADSAWSRKQDTRRTAFGALLRKLSLDELPQLWNVLKGEMSLVGPRPEIPRFVDQFRDTVPLYMMKHQVRPGMTGWAQVLGFRGDTSIPERIRCDLWYIENWSLGLDLKILYLTAFGGMINQEKLGGEKHEKHAGHRGDL